MMISQEQIVSKAPPLELRSLADVLALLRKRWK